MIVRTDRLRPGEGERWRSIRLNALAEAPDAFGTTHAEATRWPAARWEAQVVELATFVAVVDDRDVGVARGAGHPRGDVRELISMWVAPTARRQGIGALLIDAVVAWARAAGATALVLDVFAHNAPAFALYERSGFVRCDGAELGERTADEVRLVRSISS